MFPDDAASLSSPHAARGCSVIFGRRHTGAFRSAAVLLLLAAAGMLFAATPAVINPGAPWVDNRGVRIQAHGGGMTLYKGTYYWFGEDRSPTNQPDLRYVACYSSRDLVHWKFRRQVLKLADPEHLGAHWVLERPKVFVNAQ